MRNTMYLLKKRVVFFSLLSLLVAAVCGVAPVAEAAPFVARRLTLYRSSWAFNVGLGVGRLDAPDATGLGLNLEGAVGLTSYVQLGLRTGLRLGNDGRTTQADQYGRTFETETYGTGHDEVANPELSIRWLLVNERVVELGLEGRMYLPIEDDTPFGVMFGVPLAFHLAGSVRLDTGLFVPIRFDDETDSLVSIPLHLWFQLDGRMYLGLLSGFRIDDGDTAVPLGLGLGWGLSYAVDLRTWFLFPDVSESGSAKNFGLGVGFEFRI